MFLFSQMGIQINKLEAPITDGQGVRGMQSILNFTTAKKALKDSASGKESSTSVSRTNLNVSLKMTPPITLCDSQNHDDAKLEKNNLQVRFAKTVSCVVSDEPVEILTDKQSEKEDNIDMSCVNSVSPQLSPADTTTK